MDKERFLDVNGFNSEYYIPLEKRLIKYRKWDRSSASANTPVIPVTERLQARSEEWRSDIHHKQVIAAICAGGFTALAVAASVFLTYGL
ncbi:MAG: hypothetical protein Q4C36_03095 [Coriobacteriia bacterium]|nr:hypothetical protein [Coriobacteriia bacterium]